jgi:hypothetical protein
MVDFAMVTWQNGFSTCKLSLHEKPHSFIQEMTKTWDFLLLSSFYHLAVAKQDHYLTHL